MNPPYTLYALRQIDQHASCYIKACGGEAGIQSMYAQLEPLWRLKAKAVSRRWFRKIGMARPRCTHAWIVSKDGMSTKCSICQADGTVIHESTAVGTRDVGVVDWAPLWQDSPTYASVLRRPDFYLGATWR